jgi:hypothetical protein
MQDLQPCDTGHPLQLTRFQQIGRVEVRTDLQESFVAVGLEQKPSRPQGCAQERHQFTVQVEKDDDEIIVRWRHPPTGQISLHQVDLQAAAPCLSLGPGQGYSTHVDGIYLVAQGSQVQSISAKAAGHVQRLASGEQSAILDQEPIRSEMGRALSGSIFPVPTPPVRFCHILTPMYTRAKLSKASGGPTLISLRRVTDWA